MAKICIVGEAWGREEAIQGKPFVGATGWELNRLCEEAGLLPEGSAHEIGRNAYRRDEIYYNSGIHLTNVLNFRPPDNKVENICGTRSEGRWGHMPAIKSGKYLTDQHWPELDRLRDELSRHSPNLIIGLGATSQWFLLRSSAITKRRGTIAASDYGKTLTTFHPAFLVRGAWDMRPIVVFDLIKAKREADFPEVRRPQRFVHIPESPWDIERLIPEMARCQYLSVDIETFKDQITCIGFAWTTDRCLVVPIFHGQSNYWRPDDERTAWKLIRRILELPVRKLFQNGLYDIRFLWQRYGIAPRACTDDTMLLHHALQPEVQKGLGFLGSIYTDEPAWKIMRPKGKGTIKREDE